jgi:hypothetical protein
MLTTIANSALAKPLRVLLAVYQFADFSGALEGMAEPPAEGFGAQIQVMLGLHQPVVVPETDSDGEKPR